MAGGAVRPGCGVGGIVDLLGPRELTYGIDVEADVLAYAERRFAHRPDCRFSLADLNELSPERLAELRDLRFDSIVCINVLEHIRDDLAALRRMESLLVPGGVLALLVPAHQWLYGPYDAIDGHFRRYDRTSLRRLLCRAGLTPLRLHHFNVVGAVGWWVQYKLLKREIHGEGQFGMMNRVLPFVREFERRIEPPFGLSLVAVGRSASS